MKTVLVVLLGVLGLALIALADEPSSAPELRIEAGMHTAAIESIAADQSGSLVLTAGIDKTARLWELPSGRLLRVLRLPLGKAIDGSLDACSLTPDGKLAAVGGDTGPVDGTKSVYIFDTATGAVVRRFSGLTGMVTNLSFSASGRFLAVFSGGLHVWEVATGREAGRDITCEAKRFGLAWRGDDRVATACLDGKLRLYQVGGDGLKQLVEQKTTGTLPPYSISFSPDGGRLAVAFGQSPRVEVYDSLDLRSLYTANANSKEMEAEEVKVAWGVDGGTLALATGGWAGQKSQRNWQSFVRIWPNEGRGAPLDAPVSGDGISGLQSLPDGRFLFATRDPAWGVVNRQGHLNLFKGKVTVYYGDPFQVSADGTVVSFSTNSPTLGDIRFSVTERQLRPLRPRDAKELRPPRVTGLKITDWENWGSPKLEGKALVLEPGEQSHCLAIARDASSFILGTAWWLRSFSGKGDARWANRPPAFTDHVALADHDRLAIAAHRDGTVRWYRAADGLEILDFFPSRDLKRWALWAPFYETVLHPMIGITGSDHDGKVQVDSVDADGPAKGAGIEPGDIISRVNEDSVGSFSEFRARVRESVIGEKVTITFSRKGTEQSAVIRPVASPDKETRTTAVYYDCSPGAEDLIGWHVNKGRDHEADFFPAAKFRDQFYRPDVIQQVLAKGDVGEALKAANETAGRKNQPAVSALEVVAQKQPPVVELAMGGALATVTVATDAQSLSVRYRVRQGGAEPVSRVRVQVNNRPVEVAAPIPGGEKEEASVTVPLPPGECTISVFAENKYTSSQLATLRVARVPTAQLTPVPLLLKPNLYVLAVGVADLKMNDAFDLNHDGRTTEKELRIADPKETVTFADLQFADADARDVAKSFKAQEGGLYGTVETRVLENKEATAAAIRDGLEWIKRKTTARDVAVIFLSGHGENDNEGRFYFPGYDYDEKRRMNTEIKMTDIEEVVGDLAGKVVFLIDSCHAGDALGKHFKGSGAQVDITRLANELSSSENGAFFLASSTGRQVSLESEVLKHGVFAYAIIDAINGKGDLLGQGNISVLGLQVYVSKWVQDYTDGQQIPTIAAPQTVPDFSIAVKNGVR